MRIHLILSSLLLAAALPVQAQMCKIPPTGNPNCGGDSASQSSPNSSTGVGNPIDLTTGNKYQQEVDIEFPGDLSIGFRRHYNSGQGVAGVLGAGWTGTYDTRLGRTEYRGGPAGTSAPPEIRITQGDGRTIRFEPFESTPTLRRYRSIPVGYGVIEEDVAAIERLRNASRSGSAFAIQQDPVWKWQWADGRRLTFDGRGLLKSIARRDGQALTLQFDANRRFSKVTDFAGNWLAATYWDEASDRLAPFQPAGETAQHGPPHGAGYRGRLKTMTLSNGEVLRYEYDAHGNLSDVVYPDGSMRRYEYVRAGDRELLAKIYDRDGRLHATFDYDERGHAIASSHPDHRDDVKLVYHWPGPKGSTGRTEVEDATGAKTVYTWRADPNAEAPLIESADGPGCPSCALANVRYVYDKRQRETAAIRVDGSGKPLEQRSLDVDAIGRVRAIELAKFVDGKLQAPYWRETREYSGDSFLPSLIARPSIVPGQLHTLSIDYNGFGQPTRITERGFQYSDPQGTMTVSTDYRPTVALERTTTLGYVVIRGVSRLKSVDGPLAGSADTWTYSYDAAGQVQSIEYPMHLVERFERDEWGRITAHVGLDGVRETLQYGAESRVVGFTRADSWMRVQYDEAGQIRAVVNSLGQQMTMTRDAQGDLDEISDPAGNRIHWSYGPHGDVRDLTLYNPDGSVSQRGHAPTAISSSADPVLVNVQEPIAAPIRNALLAESAAAMASTWHTDSGGVTGVSREYDSSIAGLIPASTRSVLDGEGRATVYEYDDFGRMTSQRSPVTGITRYHWDSAGNLLETVQADGSVARITRDSLGRPIRLRAGSEDGRIEWGQANRPTRITFSAGEERFEYDSAARLTAHTMTVDGKTFKLSYEFDSLGRILRKHLPDGSVLRYTYNGFTSPKPGVLSAIYKEGILDQPILTGLNSAEERYADQGFVFGNGLSQRRLLNVDGEVIASGNPKVGESRLDWSRSTGSPATYFHTAGVGEQVTADVLPGLPARIAARLSALRTGDRAAAATGAASAAGAATATGYVQTDGIYDVRGQLVQDANLRYHWDAMGRLVRITKREGSGLMHASFSNGGDSDAGRVVAEYRYNLMGARIAKVVYGPGGATPSYFFWDGTELAADIDKSGKPVRDYVYLQDRPVAMLSDGAIYAIHTDHRLAPVAVTDSQRRVVWQAKVSDNGASVVDGRSTIDLPLRASNQYFDAETGLHYNLARYLNPNQGRYLSPDPMGLAAGPNLYQFALGQPHVFLDPLGLQTIPANGDVTSLSFNDRLQYVLKTALPQVPTELVGIIQSMLQPQNLEIAAGVLAVWGVAQLTPAGWIADAAVAGIGWFFLGDTAVQIAKLAYQTYQLTKNATCVSDLNAAAKNFADITASAVLALGAYGGAKLAGVLGDFFKVKTSGFWDLAPFERGVAIEKALGHNVPVNYPVIDIWDEPNGLGTSIKSVDLNAATYQNASSLKSLINGYIKTLKDFNGRDYNGLDTVNKIKNRQLDIVIPGAGTSAQQAVLQNAIADAQKLRVTLKIVILP